MSVKMEGLGYFTRIAAVLCLILVLVEGAAEDYTPTSLLAEKEGEVNGFVLAVEANAKNCDALKTCSTSTSCSRLACYQYGVQGDPNYKCQGVESNPVCGTDCTQRNFDYSRSFIRRVDSFDPNIAHTVCSQRTLDDQFRRSSIGDSNFLFRVFYGSVDGTSRLYPGLDESCESAYDCRGRPWYKVAIGVPKGVTILVDSGRSMREKLVGAKSDEETYLSKGINGALAVLPTLTEDTDYVNIQSFDRDGIKLATSKSQRYSSKLSQSFQSDLYKVVNGKVAENPTLADTTDAIKAAISEMAVSVPPDYLKMVLVFTSGEQYRNLSELGIPANSSVNVFVYNFLATSKAPECDPAVRASSEVVPVTRYDNPLLFLESAYSFLGKIHQAFAVTLVSYGEQYADSSGVDNSTLTLSKAAFGPTGELLGIVGLDFFQLKVEQQYPNIKFKDIVIAARSKSNFKFDPNALTTSVCYNHTPVCPGEQTDIQGFLCGVKIGEENIGCCGACLAKNTHKLAKILGSVFGSLFVLAVIACCYGCWQWDKKRSKF